MEQWKDIVDYEGLYQISNHGRVMSLQRIKTVVRRGGQINRLIRERILKNSKTTKDYPQIALSKNGKVKSFEIHRLVGIAFLPNQNNFKYMNHIDGNPKNNHVSNIEWCTQSHNIKHAHANKLIIPQHSEKNSQAVLTNDEVKEIRRLFHEDNMSKKEISKKYTQVSYTTIVKIINYKKWKYV